jgi:hypothetical protein
MAVPLELTAQDVTEPSDSAVELTSIGSPETDRGPPSLLIPRSNSAH